MKIAVIGAGLFGSIQTRHLTALGHDVTLINTEISYSGSKPAACLIKPSWLASMQNSQIDSSFSLLDKYYGVKDIEFLVNGKIKNTVRWVNPSHILSEAYLKCSVTNIKKQGNLGYTLFLLPDNNDLQDIVLEVDCVVVAAGYWTFPLVNIFQAGLVTETMVGQAGCAHLYKGQLEQPFIKVWAPYKQLVGFNRDDKNVWIGDGAAIKWANWNSTHSSNNLARCNKAAPAGLKLVKSIFGIRPYVKDAKPCYIKEVAPRLWAVTGGAKNGTIAAGWAAHFVGENVR